MSVGVSGNFALDIVGQISIAVVTIAVVRIGEYADVEL
jgi:hypothetical protein